MILNVGCNASGTVPILKLKSTDTAFRIFEVMNRMIEIGTPREILRPSKFDAVQMMREIREKLSEKYWKHRDILRKEMQAIREKYNLKLAPD